VACDEDGNVVGGKSAGDEGGGRATAMREMAAMMSTTWVMATCTLSVHVQGWRATKRKRARAARAMMTAMRVAGNEEGEGGKAMATVTSGRADGDGDEEGDGNGNMGGR
jgi:hypothetical protein